MHINEKGAELPHPRGYLQAYDYKDLPTSLFLWTSMRSQRLLVLIKIVVCASGFMGGAENEN